MTDDLAMDPERVRADGQMLQEFAEFLAERKADIAAWLSQIDPAKSQDPTGQTIGAQYFENANSLLDEIDRVVADIEEVGTRVVEAADLGEESEAARAADIRASWDVEQSSIGAVTIGVQHANVDSAS